jgi:CheY-like chemotaxis protein
MKVLIVDDDSDIREALSDALTDHGYEVATAADGRDALDWLHTHPAPCLILLDWMMPRCDGLTFRKEQKQDPDPAIAQIPVVLLTADYQFDRKRDALDALAHLSKPVSLENLLSVVQRCC